MSRTAALISLILVLPILLNASAAGADLTEALGKRSEEIRQTCRKPAKWQGLVEPAYRCIRADGSSFFYSLSDDGRVTAVLYRKLVNTSAFKDKYRKYAESIQKAKRYTFVVEMDSFGKGGFFYYIVDRDDQRGRFKPCLVGRRLIGVSPRFSVFEEYTVSTVWLGNDICHPTKLP